MSFMKSDNYDLILNRFTNEFRMSYLNDIYNNQINKKLKTENLILSTFNFISAFIIMIAVCSSFIFVSNNDYDHISINLIIDFNVTHSFQNVNISKYLIFNKFLLINDTNSLSNSSLIDRVLISSEENSIFIVKSVYANKCVIVIGVMLILYLASAIMTCLCKKKIYQNFVFILNTILFNESFQIISYLLILYFKVESTSVFYILTTQIFLKLFFTNNSSYSWLWFGIGIFSNSFIDVFILFGLGNSNLTAVNYTIVNFLYNQVCIILFYLRENNSRSEFFLKYNLNKERKSAVDLIYNMNMGYLKYNNLDTFINKSLIKTLDSVNAKDYNLDENYSLSNCEFNDNKSKSFTFHNLDNYATELNKNFLKERNEYFIKILEEVIIDITNLNKDFPQVIQDMFSNKSKKFNFYAFFLEIKKLKDLDKFKNLGNLDIKLKKNGTIITKKFDIIIRVNNDDKLDKNLEIIFSDVTDIVEIEKEKAIEKSRSIYLTKIAHEFKNPLTSIMQLSNTISSHSQKYLDTSFKNEDENQLKFDTSNDDYFSIEKSDLKEIINNSEYIEVICKKMCQFIKDYSILNNLKFPCEGNCKNLKLCSLCNKHDSLCEICNICLNCDNKDKINLNVDDMVNNIKATFEQLSLFEKKEAMLINYNCDLLQYRETLANYEMFYSTIFNLMLFSYKNNTINPQIDIRLYDKPNSDNQINLEITTFCQPINPKFLQLLNSNTNFTKKENLDSLNNPNQNDLDLLILYFEILISYQLLRKLDGEIVISTTSDKTTFSITIDKVVDNNYLDITRYNKPRLSIIVKSNSSIATVVHK